MQRKVILATKRTNVKRIKINFNQICPTPLKSILFQLINEKIKIK